MHKFLTDGRKVVVVGSVSKTQHIVQEIFITKDGSEIPSGDNFVVETLHDEPVKTYKEKQAEEAERKVQKAEDDLKKINSQIKEKQNELQMTKDYVKSSLSSVKSIKENKYILENLTNFLSGNINWIIREDSYGVTDIIKFGKAISDLDRYYTPPCYNGLKLMSLFGKEDGNLEFNINEYKCGSGNWHKISMFKTYDEAIERLIEIQNERLKEDKFRLADVEHCKKYGILGRIDQELLKKCVSEIKNKKDEDFKKNMDGLIQNYDNSIAVIISLEKELENK